MSMGTRAKLSAVEWDAFSRRSRRLLHWSKGEVKRIKRMFWRRQRAAEKCDRILVDREGVAYPPVTPVALKSKGTEG